MPWCSHLGFMAQRPQQLQEQMFGWVHVLQVWCPTKEQVLATIALLRCMMGEEDQSRLM